MMISDIRAALLKLLAFCEANNWAGYDPYDALNSRLLKRFPLLNSRVPQIIFTQALKRSPINIRPFLLVPKLQNPKGIALFLSALVRLSSAGELNLPQLKHTFVERLIALRSSGVPYWCWGYSFPWQTRTIVVPRGAPNLVCTSFVANVLLDVYEESGDSACLLMATSAAEYMVNELYWSSDACAGFSYPQPSVHVQIHNANFLAAALLCRVYKHTGERKFMLPALRAARISAEAQKRDGSWTYGETASQQWIDNFHTGYNLCALRSIARNVDTAEFDRHIKKGFDFYRKHFFCENGVVKYFHDRTYPIDIHALAQSIITLVELQDLDSGNIPLAHSVMQWAMKHMWDRRGFFYYRVLRVCTVRTPYMRWSQAWMFLGISMLLCECSAAVKNVNGEIPRACMEAC